jgi:hypothetical protein
LCHMWRKIGLWVLTSGRLRSEIEQRVKFHSPFFRPVLFQRDDNLSLASPAL